MTLVAQAIAAATLVASPHALLAATEPAPVPPEMQPDYRVDLTDADLKAITLEVLQRFPVLSSSPGIKYAEGHHQYYAEDNQEDQPVAKGVGADVIFYPHAESAGIKYALETHCLQSDAGQNWTCPIVELRRYVRLESQDFEVRVKGDLNLPAVQAIVQASRGLAAAAGSRGSSAFDTVQTIFSCSDGYFVSWGTEDFKEGVIFKAKLHDGGDPADPEDWQVQLLPES